jgi:iron complex outermembrane recepter protein
MQRTTQRMLRTARVTAAAFAGLAWFSLEAKSAEPPNDLTRMSIEDLAKLEVTTASKTNDPLQRVAASVYVITHEDIARSGATSVPEALRLAPNLDVVQTSASSYVISIRGFGGNPAAQNFANKILMVIDGRSVYSPLFSGMYHDAQDLVMDDIERIEVLSGPGATLWGANAMNGVINVVTRNAFLTDGTLIKAAAGNREQSAALRYGARNGNGSAYRVYGKVFSRGALDLEDGSDAQDDWYKAQAGARYDWSGTNAGTTVQGDVYRAVQSQAGMASGSIAGGNIIGRWHRQSDRADLQIQAYIDETQRTAPADGVAFVLHTYDFEIQQRLAWAERHTLVWGGGERINDYSIHNAATLLFEPHTRHLTLGNVFAQDDMEIGDRVTLTAGIKLEDDPFSGWNTQPDLRASWAVSDQMVLWAAAAQAVRSPTPFDHDVIERVGTTTFLTGNAWFRPERVTTYEMGYRGQPVQGFSMSLTAFYNEYRDLRTIETASDTVFLPLHWGNRMRGNTYGMEAWADWQVLDWWRLSPSVTLLQKRLRFDSGSSGLLGLAEAGDDPRTQAMLKSAMELGRSLAWDASLRYVSALPDPALPSYVELTARVDWRISANCDVSLNAWNVLHDHHMEFSAPTGEVIGRKLMLEARWRL